MEKNFFLRMEGVNIANFIYDTQDLSTIRGGGLLLLDSVRIIQDNFKQLKPVSTGASSGLFEFAVEGEDPEQAAEKLRADIEAFLNGHNGLGHATFVVDILPEGTDFLSDRELLIAKNRWRQMRSPAVAVPATNSEKEIFPCDEDMVRPADKTWERKHKDPRVSGSVKARYDYGHDKKQKFYDGETKKELGMKYVWDFDKLSADPAKGNLHHKMAVIYLDGNRFGDLQRCCKDKDALRTLYDTIMDYRETLLIRLLESMKGKADWLSSEDRYRIETLLWGGDEIIWVVPAWKGWETLKFFYDNSREWKFNDKALTHSAGMVFCHHNAPIHRITALAHDLAELAKERLRAEKADMNLFAYQVLESIDFVAGDLKEFRRSRCPVIESDAMNKLLLTGEGMSEAAACMKKLKKEFPKSKLHQIVSGLLSSKAEANEKAKSIMDETIKSLPQSAGELTRLGDVFNGDYMKWIHMVELWDYIPLDEEG